MVDTVAIIPARSGSKGVKDKNIKLLAGKPLLAYSILAAKLTKNIDRVIVSTESGHYADIAKKYGAEVPFLRPKEISKDNSTDYEWIRHTIDWLKKEKGTIPNYLVHLRPTTPFRDPAYMEKAIESLKSDNNATALRSVHEMSETAYKTVEIDKGYLKSICSGSFDLDVINQPRQQFPKTYVANGYIDIYRSAYILKNMKLFGDMVIAYITPSVIEVDTLEDFDYLEFQAKSDSAIINTLFKGKKN